VEGDTFHYLSFYFFIEHSAMMLKSIVMSEDDYASFFRPAVLDSLRQVLKYYSLDNASQIIYNGENDVAKLIGSNSDDGLRGDMFTDGIFRNKLFIVVEKEDTPFNTGYSNQRREPTERPVWLTEEEKPMGLYPAFSGVKVNVSVVASFNSSKLADHYVRRINRLRDNQMADMAFSATVHLGVNNSIIACMQDIHALILKNEPTTPEFGLWFNKYCRVPFTTISNVAGKNKRLVVPQRLDYIGIQFSDAEIQRARRGSSSKFEAEFKYSFYFNEFTNWEFFYPLDVYQDEIPEKWIPIPNEQFTRPFNVRTAPEVAWGLSNQTTRQTEAPYFLKLPKHDPWVMARMPFVQPIIQARLAVEDVEGQELVNIFDIPGFKWSEQVKAYMLRRHKVAFTQYATPFLIWVYSNDLRILPTQLSMDETGSVTLSRKPTMKNVHHIVVTLDYSIRDYTDDFWDDLSKNPQDLNLLPAIFPWYHWNKLPQPWLNHINQIRKDIDKGLGLPGDNPTRYMMNLGLNSYVLVEDKR
jgi:hypothetical protein